MQGKAGKSKRLTIGSGHGSKDCSGRAAFLPCRSGDRQTKKKEERRLPHRRYSLRSSLFVKREVVRLAHHSSATGRLNLHKHAFCSGFVHHLRYSHEERTLVRVRLR